MVMLKKKQEVNYRRGTTGRHCAVCDHFEAAFQVRGCNSERLTAIVGMNDAPAYGYCAGCGEPCALDPDGHGLCAECEAASDKRAVAWSAK